MKRRDFLKKAGIATVGAGLSPLMFANAQRSTYRFEMVTSWPTALDAIYGGAVNTARYLSEMTDGDVEVDVYPAGAQVGAFEVYDAVSSGAFAMGHAAPYYFYNKNPVHAFFTAVPFGMDASQFDAWMNAGDGQAFSDELTTPDDVIMFPAGNTGPQTSGWFKREVNTVADLQGLTIRTPGFGGQVLSKVGANVQNVPGGEVFISLETGVLDAADWVGPYDDEILGLQNAAPYYYLPSWAEPGASLAVYMNRSMYNDLPTSIQEALKAAAARANQQMLADYTAKNDAALARLVAGGTQIRTMSNEILQALQAATNEIHEENAQGNDLYVRVLENYRAFLAAARAWNRVSGYTYDTFVFGDLCEP
jgi:TRAP-type mannitol/chloroaromatic compound transport system substrate-binding protein